MKGNKRRKIARNRFLARGSRSQGMGVLVRKKPSTPKRSVWGTVKPYVGAASGAALGYMAGNVPGMVVGGQFGYKMGSRKSVKSTKGGYRIVSKGRKRGRFNRKLANVKTETKALTHGYHCTSEIHANVTDPHAVYVAHSASHYGLMIRTFMGAMFRKLFLKAGLPVPNRDEELPFFSQFNSDGFKLVYTFQNPVTGAASTLEYTTTDNQTFTAVIDSWPALYNHFDQILTGAIGSEPQIISVYSSDRNGLDTNWRLASQLNLRNEIINWRIVSDLKVQNRTSGAAATGEDIGDADRVDQQPLRGLLYNFKGGEPRLKHTTNNILNDDEKLSRIRFYGENHIPAALLPQPYQECPMPKLWTNCTGASKVVLQPGDIKNTKISYSFRGKVPTLLKKLKLTFTESNFVKGVPGVCQILALEEYMRTPSANNILIGLEREIKIGCWLDTGKTVDVFTSDYSEASPGNG